MSQRQLKQGKIVEAIAQLALEALVRRHFTKLQASSSKPQKSSKFQSPNMLQGANRYLELGDWCFSGAWSLEFGASSFPWRGGGFRGLVRGRLRWISWSLS